MLKRYIKKEKQSFKNENEVSSNPRITYIIKNNPFIPSI